MHPRPKWKSEGIPLSRDHDPSLQIMLMSWFSRIDLVVPRLATFSIAAYAFRRCYVLREKLLPYWIEGPIIFQLSLCWQLRAMKCYWNSSITISGFDPSRSGGPHVPAPLEVKICIRPIRLKPYTNCRYILRAIQLQGMNCPRCVCPDS